MSSFFISLHRGQFTLVTRCLRFVVTSSKTSRMRAWPSSLESSSERNWRGGNGLMLLLRRLDRLHDDVLREADMVDLRLRMTRPERPSAFHPHPGRWQFGRPNEDGLRGCRCRRLLDHPV